MRLRIEKSGVALPALTGLILVLAACTQPTGQQTNSPEPSPSAQASATPSTAPSPAESPTPDASPTPAASPKGPKLIITKVPFHIGEVGLAYATVVLGAAGGIKPYKWSMSSGTLPPGLAMSTGGSVTGKPTTVGNFAFTVRVDDAAGGAAGVARIVTVFKQIAWVTTGASCTAFGNPAACTTPTLKYTAGASNTPKVRVTPDAGYPNLPPGSTFVVRSGVVSFNIPGPACNTPNYDSVFSVVLIDQSPCVAGFRCTSGPLALDIHLSNNC